MKTIIVTGGNRGIGFEICRQLDTLGHNVIMGSRDLENGIEAAKKFDNNIIVKQLDVNDEESVIKALNFVKAEFGRLDVLINNAGLGSTHFNQNKTIVSGTKSMLKAKLPGAQYLARLVKPLMQKVGVIATHAMASDIPFGEVKHIMETNLYGPWRMIQAFLPLLQKSDEGRIINISSGMGEINSLAGDYPAYRLSKSSLNALTIMLSRELAAKGIIVNAMCPGWVKTDMGGPDAPREVSKGADTAVWLATEKEIPNGKFFRDRQVIDW